MICHQDKCLFVHIPKNAGQSIEYVFLQRHGLTLEQREVLHLHFDPNWRATGLPQLSHLHAAHYVARGYLTQQQFDAYFKFAIIRNPWDRLVSTYKYYGYDKRCDFRTFLLERFPTEMWKKNQWFVAPQADFVCDAKGALLVDFLMRFSHLQEDFHVVAARLGLPTTPLPHLNKSRPKGILRLLRQPHRLKNELRALWLRLPKHPNYQGYYDEETRAAAAHYYARDIALFGFDFDDPVPRNVQGGRLLTG